MMVGVIGYNYFLGTPEEKESSQKIINKTKDTFSDIKDVFVKERQKFKDGKYDEALAKVGSSVRKLREVATEKGGALLDKIESLEERKKQLEDAISSTKSESDGEAKDDRIKDLGKQIEALEKETLTLEQEAGR